MPSKYSCPRCISDDIVEYNDHIECLKCGLNFHLDSIDNKIDNENIMAEEELNEFFDAFENGDRKKLFKIFKDDEGL